MQILGSVSSPGTPSSGSGRMRLFVGNDIAYTIYRRGYNTLDVSDPADPLLITYQPRSLVGNTWS